MATEINQYCPNLKKEFKEALKYVKKRNFHKVLADKPSLSQTFLYPLHRYTFYNESYKLDKFGDKGERSVTAIIRKELNDEWYYINKAHIKSPYDGTLVQIDHLVFSPYGVFIVETKNWYGTIFEENNQWYTLSRYGRKNLKNPAEQVKRYQKVVEEYLSFAHLYGTITPIILFVGKSTLKISKDTRAFNSTKQLIKYLKGLPHHSFNREEMQVLKVQLYNPEMNPSAPRMWFHKKL